MSFKIAAKLLSSLAMGRLVFIILLSFCLSTRTVQAAGTNNKAIYEDLLMDDEKSTLSRRMASLGSRSTMPMETKILVKRATYPQNSKDAHICLAFLSCCDRTDLLNHTLAGVIRHMEEDEPSFLNYEIAWVDNGSDPDLTAEIVDSYEIEHALRLPQNMGLAYGLNSLIFNLCTAPYILLLEEDWLYLDELVAPQTPERKRVIATSIALIENLSQKNLTAYDGRTVMGVFLRHESYETFLTFPHADVWETLEQVDIAKELPSSSSGREEQCQREKQNSLVANIDYRIFCADTGIQRESIWGSYTNGAGLYRRSYLMQIGRMFGEPGDAFHDRYVEGNYAFRAAIGYCHAAVLLTEDRTCKSIQNPLCTGAFHHIGGGRGTRPMTAKGTTCDDPAWNFFGTPLYSKYHKFVEEATGQPVQRCSKEELEQLRERKFRDLDAEEYRKKVKEDNEKVFQMERAEREKMRRQADAVLNLLATNPEKLRGDVSWMKDMSDEDIVDMADKMKRLADSPHPIQGFWDSHGRVTANDQKTSK